MDITYLLAIVCFLIGLPAASSEADIPIQIVKPSSNHRELELVEDNLAYLRNLKGSVAIALLKTDPTNSKIIMEPVISTNSHEPRIELRYQSRHPYVSLDERTTNNSVVAAIIVSDEDDGPNGQTSLSIDHGNELGHFKLVSTPLSHTIQVNGAPLSKQKVPEYNLTIIARDNGIPQKSSSVNLVIKLQTSGYPPPSSLISPTLNPNAPLEPQPSLKPPVNDLMYMGSMLVVVFSAVIFILIIACALFQRPKSKKNCLPARREGHPSDHCLCLGLTSV